MSTKTSTKSSSAKNKKSVVETPAANVSNVAVPTVTPVVAAPTVTPTVAPVASNASSSRKKTKNSSTTATSNVSSSTQPNSSTNSEVNNKSQDKKQRVRRNVNVASVQADFDTLNTKIEEEITKIKGSDEKVKGVKFLKSMNKLVKLLKSDTIRLLKLKPKTKRSRSSNSGFMKPVRISPEMSTFTGWDVSKPCSRIDVTKFICAYIKSKNLQNPQDRRIICHENDPSLKALLNYTSPEPLTYFRLQGCIQKHFLKEDTVNA